MYYSEDERLEIGGREYKEFSKIMGQYHNRIMNIQSDVEHFDRESRILYKTGHAHARHAAAEIAIEAEKEIEELKETVASLEEVLTGAENIGPTHVRIKL